jgi:arylsulfatase A-like enzyme
MTRRSFLQTGLAAATAAAAPAQAVRPNVLFIMLDQWRFDCLGAHGNSLIRTPNLDRLAARSADMTQTCVQAPVCVPSRISFFTGRYPHSHKNRVNYTPYEQPEPMIQRLLHDAGYQTGSVGKLHFHPPTPEHARSTGFDRVLLDDGINRTDRYSDYVKWREEHDPKADVYYQKTVQKPPPGQNPFRAVIDEDFTPTAWTSEQTRAVLGDFASASKPFFLYSSYFKPHSPHTIPQPYDALYNDVTIPLPKQVDIESIQRLPLPVQKMILRSKVYDMDRENLEWRYRSYYGDVTWLDEEVGKTLDELDRHGLTDNTIIIVSTDHGDQMLEHGLFGKNVFFEDSVHIPLLVSWPKHVRPGVYSELIEAVDVLPTVLELCGLPIPDHVQGRSFAALIAGDRAQYRPREAIFAENIMPEVITDGDEGYFFEPGQGVGGIRHPDAKMVRTNRWKLNYYVGHGGELYDLENDPGEWNNLYDDPEHAAIVQELKGVLLDWLISADENDQIAPKWLI